MFCPFKSGIILLTSQTVVVRREPVILNHEHIDQHLNSYPSCVALPMYRRKPTAPMTFLSLSYIRLLRCEGNEYGQT